MINAIPSNVRMDPIPSAANRLNPVWLYGITWREGLRHIEKQKRLEQNKAPVVEIEIQPDPGEDIIEVLERRETAEHVQWGLSKLRLIDLEILALRYLEELDTTELAQRLNIPVGTVKARIHRALARLKILLEKDHYE